MTLTMIVLACTGLGNTVNAQLVVPEVPTYSTPLLQKLTVIDTSQSSSMMYNVFDYAKAYHNSLGIFCKGENLISKNAPVNFRFRLGNLDYVNKLEGKTK